MIQMVAQSLDGVEVHRIDIPERTEIQHNDSLYNMIVILNIIMFE